MLNFRLGVRELANLIVEEQNTHRAKKNCFKATVDANKAENNSDLTLLYECASPRNYGNCNEEMLEEGEVELAEGRESGEVVRISSGLYAVNSLTRESDHTYFLGCKSFSSSCENQETNCAEADGPNFHDTIDFDKVKATTIKNNLNDFLKFNEENNTNVDSDLNKDTFSVSKQDLKHTEFIKKNALSGNSKIKSASCTEAVQNIEATLNKPGSLQFKSVPGFVPFKTPRRRRRLFGKNVEPKLQGVANVSSPMHPDKYMFVGVGMNIRKLRRRKRRNKNKDKLSAINQQQGTEEEYGEVEQGECYAEIIVNKENAVNGENAINSIKKLLRMPVMKTPKFRSFSKTGKATKLKGKKKEKLNPKKFPLEVPTMFNFSIDNPIDKNHPDFEYNYLHVEGVAEVCCVCLEQGSSDEMQVIVNGTICNDFGRIFSIILKWTGSALVSPYCCLKCSDKVLDCFHTLLELNLGVATSHRKWKPNGKDTPPSHLVCAVCRSEHNSHQELTDHVMLHAVEPLVIPDQVEKEEKNLKNVSVNINVGVNVEEGELLPLNIPDKPVILDTEHNYSMTVGQSEKLCHICGVTKMGKHAMATHLRHHRGEKIRNCCHCKICKIDIPDRIELQKHRIEVHKLKDELPKTVYKCRLCTKVFTGKNTRAAHELSNHNTGDNFYSCPVCPKKFLFKKGVDSHCSRVHPGLIEKKKRVRIRKKNVENNNGMCSKSPAQINRLGDDKSNYCGEMNKLPKRKRINNLKILNEINIEPTVSSKSCDNVVLGKLIIEEKKRKKRKISEKEEKYMQYREDEIAGQFLMDYVNSGCYEELVSSSFPS